MRMFPVTLLQCRFFIVYRYFYVDIGLAGDII